MSSIERMPPPTVKGTKTCSATPRTVSRSILRCCGAGHDVVEDDLVDLVVVEQLRELGRGRDVDVVLELLGLRDAPVDDVEAGDEPLGQHSAPSQAAKPRSRRRPSSPLFSAWNWVAITLLPARRPSRTRRRTRWCRARRRRRRAPRSTSSRSSSAVASGRPATTGCSRAKRTSFQPICGTRSVSGKRRTSPWSQPRPSVPALLAALEQHLEPDADAEERHPVVERPGPRSGSSERRTPSSDASVAAGRADARAGSGGRRPSSPPASATRRGVEAEPLERVHDARGVAGPVVDDADHDGLGSRTGAATIRSSLRSGRERGHAASRPEPVRRGVIA